MIFSGGSKRHGNEARYLWILENFLKRLGRKQQEVNSRQIRSREGPDMVGEWEYLAGPVVKF